MFARAMELIRGLLAMINVEGLDSAAIREALLQVLAGLKANAKLTPTIWDDIAIGIAEGLVKQFWTQVQVALDNDLQALAALECKVNAGEVA